MQKSEKPKDLSLSYQVHNDSKAYSYGSEADDCKLNYVDTIEEEEEEKENEEIEEKIEIEEKTESPTLPPLIRTSSFRLQEEKFNENRKLFTQLRRRSVEPSTQHFWQEFFDGDPKYSS